MIWAISRVLNLWISVNCVHSVCEWNGVVEGERDCDLISGMNMITMTYICSQMSMCTSQMSNKCLNTILSSSAWSMCFFIILE